jgi:hypothetical protein
LTFDAVDLRSDSYFVLLEIDLGPQDGQ